MKRLPPYFGTVLTEIAKSYNVGDKLSYKDICFIYRNINKLLEDNSCEVYDLNRILSDYNIKGGYLDTVNNLRSFVKRKNKKIVRRARKSSLWSNCLSKLDKDAKECFGETIEGKILEKSFLQVLSKYSKNWLGYWSIIETGKSGSIKQIHLFAPNDYDKFFYYLAQNTGKSIKSKAMKDKVKRFSKKST